MEYNISALSQKYLCVKREEFKNSRIEK